MIIEPCVLLFKMSSREKSTTGSDDPANNELVGDVNEGVHTFEAEVLISLLEFRHCFT